MKTKDKMIIAFFVTAGLFSTAQAEQYVSKLSAPEKAKFASTISAAEGSIMVCEGVKIDTDTDPAKRL
ncbi:MAG: hypothetical protein NTY45_09845 [Elusimicrobia bacterium]|nr:hypothetical protein [Elusimicrobiota bacterium]